MRRLRLPVVGQFVGAYLAPIGAFLRLVRMLQLPKCLGNDGNTWRENLPNQGAHMRRGRFVRHLRGLLGTVCALRECLLG